jgi:predicted small lipoprotein YifL
MQFIAKFAVIVALTTLFGCGLKGPLRLPEDATTTSSDGTTTTQTKKNRANSATSAPTPSATDPNRPATPPQGGAG